MKAIIHYSILLVLILQAHTVYSQSINLSSDRKNTSLSEKNYERFLLAFETNKYKKTTICQQTDADLLTESDKKKANVFLIGGLAVHPSQKSFYTLGGVLINDFGGYLKVKTNFNFNLSISGWSESSSLFSKELDKVRFGGTGGIMYRLSEPLIIYVGAGYGIRYVNWETYFGNSCTVSDISHEGLELETGIIFKVNRFLFNAGLSSISSKYLETNFGIGLIF